MIGYLLLNLGLHLALALLLPMSNDEAYYWEWGQWLQWSYFDHPPGVSWMTALASLFADGKLGVRLLAPFFHTGLLWINFRILKLLCPSTLLARRQKEVFLFTLFCPGLFMMGSLAMPDMGLWFFLQLALWYSLKISYRPKLGSLQGLLWGASLGAAALFKYHAFPMGFSIGIGLLFLRLRQGKREPMFFITGLFAALVILSPVWIWNIQHDWASFRFQAAHGFAGGSLSLVWPLQALLACMLVIGPPLFFASLVSFWPRRSWWEDPLSILTLPAVFALFLLLGTAALRKPILPHWILPAFALATPWLVLQLSFEKKARWTQWQAAYGSGLLLIIALLANPWTLKTHILPLFQGNPGALSEVTVWDELAPSLRQKLGEWEKDSALLPGSEDCDAKLSLATYRWWGAAQLHFRLAERPPVMALQRLNGGFYNQRDAERVLTPCPLAILLTGDQYKARAGLQDMEVLRIESLAVPQHEKQSWILLLGRRIHLPSAQRKS